MPFAVSWFINMFQFMVLFMLVTTIAKYAMDHFSASAMGGGLASSSFIIGAMFARLFSAYATDLIGYRKFAVANLLASLAVFPFYFLADNLLVLLSVRTLHGLFFALAGTAVMSCAQYYIPESRRAEGNGYFALSTTFATAAGPALGLHLSRSISFDAVVMVAMLLSASSLALSLCLPQPSRRSTPTFTLDYVAHRSAVPAGLLMLMIGFCYSGVVSYLVIFSDLRAVTTGSGYFFLASALVMLLSRPLLGRFQDIKGDLPVLLIGITSFAAALCLLAFATEDWQVPVAGALTGLGYGTLVPACQTIAVRAVPKKYIASAVSTMFLFTDIGIGSAPIVLGFIISAAGFGPMYAGLAAVTVVSGVAYASTRLLRR